jgi:hypothetical protein
MFKKYDNSFFVAKTFLFEFFLSQQEQQEQQEQSASF